jgi:hypothetical protein
MHTTEIHDFSGLKAKKCVWLGRVYRDLPAHPCWIPLPSSGLNAVS